MRAAVLRELNGPLSVEDVELAEPGTGEVAVRLAASGVCHSDWNVITGATPNPLPAVLGHEGAGVVEQVGDSVTGVSAGDHVVLSWLPSCGACFFCVQGRGVLCDAAMADMFEGTLPGGSLALSQAGTPLYHYSFLSTFAERCVVPETCCVPIQRDAPLEVAALVGCAVMTGFGAAVLRARVEPGSTAAVYGAGGVGLSAILGCRLAGARAIVAADPVPFRRETAPSLGATHAVDPRSDDVAGLLRELTDGRGADYAFDAAGAPGVVAEAYYAVRRGGLVVAVGIPPVGETADIPAPSLPREEKVVTGSFYGSCRPHVDMPLVIDLYMEGRLDLDALITREFALDEINEAFAAMNAGEVARGVIRF
ncbi:MAG TPA: Zn-dependent alcohol dehydrogenase [Vicinamibacteria bacterium]|nr:Zn-dependent alcohol dehydrogenase [Vicinamibacteria bacterium]